MTDPPERREDSWSGAPAFAVWRQDDNGNEALVADGLSREIAERLACELEAKGHKQMYWVAPVEA